MADELRDLIKRYVKEALDEYLQEVWSERPNDVEPPPARFWPLLYRDVGRRLDRSVSALEYSVAEFGRLSAQPWTSRCSEAAAIASIKTTSEATKQAVEGIKNSLGNSGRP
ncbi:MAG: hypothetical protein ACRDGM_14165 [bacterium]